MRNVELAQWAVARLELLVRARARAGDVFTDGVLGGGAEVDYVYGLDGAGPVLGRIGQAE